MVTFLIGVLILCGGYFSYGKLIERLFAPDDRPTPALASPDGVDRVPLPLWKNLLIQLLNIAGVGPVIGVILGIKFGAIVFIILPIGNVIGGAVHDYFSGMISMRHNGANTPALVRYYLGEKIHHVYTWFLALTLLLVGAVFINIPAGIVSAENRTMFWCVASLIFVYYFAATFFPIDKIIGRIYPIFGVLLILSSVAILITLFPHINLLQELDFGKPLNCHPKQEPLIPMLFVTIACGIISGFHSTQSPIIARTMTSERQGRMAFYGMMIIEGLIGMIWAAAGMAIYAYKENLLASGNGTMILRELVDWLLGPKIGWVALAGVIVLAITSGDTALRSLRLVMAEYFDVDQQAVTKRLLTVVPIFSAVILLLLWSNTDPNGFKALWNYFAWSNQVIAVFALFISAVWLAWNGHQPWVALLPGAFMLYVVSTYILWVSPSNLAGAPVGFGLPRHTALVVAGIITSIISILIWLQGKRQPRAK